MHIDHPSIGCDIPGFDGKPWAGHVKKDHHGKCERLGSSSFMLSGDDPQEIKQAQPIPCQLTIMFRTVNNFN